MSHQDDLGEARAAAPPIIADPPAGPPPDIRFALRLIMLAGGEGAGGSRGVPTGGLLGRRDEIS